MSDQTIEFLPPSFLRRAIMLLLLCPSLGLVTTGIATLHASQCGSADYTITSGCLDGAGRKTTSAAYSNDGSVGGITGISTVATPLATAKSGYLGQLYEATALRITSSLSTINECSTIQLAGAQLLDDATTLAVPASAITWSVQSGPITTISVGGLATAAAVYQNTSATVQGFYAGLTGTLSLTVLDTIPDNFGIYAADGLPDDWQVRYFGLNNPAAGPLQYPTGDGENNLFKFTAGLVPTDPTSHFSVNLIIPADQPAQRIIVFSPRLPDRTYTIETSTTLMTWTEVTDATVTDNGIERTATMLNVSSSAQFFRVRVTSP